METRWWERFWKYKTTDNNQHDWFGIWADIKISGKEKSIYYETTNTVRRT